MPQDHYCLQSLRFGTICRGATDKKHTLVWQLVLPPTSQSDLHGRNSTCPCSTPPPPPAAACTMVPALPPVPDLSCSPSVSGQGLRLCSGLCPACCLRSCAQRTVSCPPCPSGPTTLLDPFLHHGNLMHCFSVVTIYLPFSSFYYPAPRSLITGTGSRSDSFPRIPPPPQPRTLWFSPLPFQGHDPWWSLPRSYILLIITEMHTATTQITFFFF